MSKTAASILIIAMALLCGFLVWERSVRKMDSDIANRKLAALAASVEAIHDTPIATVRIIERTVAPASGSAPDLGRSSQEPLGASPGHVVDEREAAEQSAARRAQFEKVFETEPQDPQWSVLAERTLNGEINGIVSDRRKVHSVSCRASVCRIDAEFASVQDYNLFWDGLFRPRNNPLMGFYGGFEIPDSERREDGSYRVRAYMLRAGQAAP